MWFAQALGCVAFFIGVAAFWQKDDVRFRYLLVMFCGIMAGHFFLMEATVAAIGVTINGLRIYASVKSHSRYVMWFFITIMCLMTLPHVTHLLEFFTVLGSSISTWAMFSRRGITMRLFILFNSLCWFSHNLWLGSIGGTLIEGTFIVTNIVTIYKLYSSRVPSVVER